MRCSKYILFLSSMLMAACSEGTIVINDGSTGDEQEENENKDPETKPGKDPGKEDPDEKPEEKPGGKEKDPSKPENKDCQGTCIDGDKKCDGNVSMACVVDKDGCPGWVPRDCEEEEDCVSGVCVPKTAPAPSCANECDNENDQICDEQADASGYKKCSNFDDDVCLEWSEFIPCPEGTACSGGSCGGCTNECPAEGNVECSGEGYRTCVDKNEDGCFEWSDVVPCEHGCESGHCACANACEPGQKECSGEGFRTCEDANSDGCYEWSAVTACPNGCDGGSCSCKHECEANQKECSGEGCRTCTADADGCRIWSAVTRCEHGCSSGSCQEAPKNEPTRYPGDKILSPVTPYVVQSMKNIAAKNTSQKNDVFMKVGDSHMADGAVFMRCFSNSKSQKPKLNGADFLQSVINEFQKSLDSFNRDSKSTVIGKTAWWANSGPLKEEMNAIHPRFAFYGYGSNDMEWHEYEFKNYFLTLEWFYRELRKGLKTMMDSGIIPLLIGTGVRTDKPSKASDGHYPFYLVPVFDAVSRGLAEQYQIPYMNLQLAQQPLKDNNYGLGSDGLHHSSSGGGCDFTDSVMKKYGANVRNRYAIEMLDRAWKMLYKNESAPDAVIPFKGSGTASDPYIIDSLPYTHPGNTNKGTNSISQYPKCRDTNESGPEIYYKLELKNKTKFRAFAVSASEVDVDIHILNGSNKADSCMKAANRYVEGNFDAGTYYFSVDTCDGAGNAGEYLFGVIPCLSGDPVCGSSLSGG
ncbi:MAG: hypothetical protein IJM59_00125 [Proteobacteria bacterium]|nr:hypothetical protein [Pseudomonadota bacterium]